MHTREKEITGNTVVTYTTGKNITEFENHFLDVLDYMINGEDNNENT